ncbi:cell division protein FtsZ [Alphaproteobacteria bacterium]|nr:cell division protein FtsZ [Alphaproteobacteria bacterium]GHS98598.1 cell division protein FtsZ [Alphaproteobacteria bacterium]
MAGDFSLRPKITVIGVGGAGCNAVNNMVRAQLEGVEFLVANTDAQALDQSLVDISCRIQLGPEKTKGLGAGSKPDVGQVAAEESIPDLLPHIQNSNMIFITAGMGGGTGTGAAPVIARIAREEGILTVGVVTKPFFFEGAKRSAAAEKGVSDLKKHVDTLIIIPNQNLFRIANDQTTFADAFKMADEVLYSGVRSVTDLMTMPGLINLDFADVKAVMAEMGNAMMGTGEAEGERRALDAAEAAIANPLLDDVSLKGAKGVLISITGGKDMTLFEVDEATNRIREDVDNEANIIFGSTFDERLEGRIRVSVVATGIGVESENAPAPVAPVPEAEPTSPSGVMRKIFGGTQAMSANSGLYAQGIATPVEEVARSEAAGNYGTSDGLGNNVFVSEELPAQNKASTQELEAPFPTGMNGGAPQDRRATDPRAPYYAQPVSPAREETRTKRPSFLKRLTRPSPRNRVEYENLPQNAEKSYEKEGGDFELPAFLRRGDPKR